MDYQKLLNESLIEFVKKVLSIVQLEGLVGDHHFYLSFITNDPEVRLSERVKSNYPDEITIVLQNQFEKLIVNPDSFSVKLAFNNIPEVIVVPFRCLTSFADPSVNFNLQFRHKALTSDTIILRNLNKKEKKQDSNKKPELDKPTRITNNVIILDKFRK